MLNKEQNDKFIILCKEIVPEYILRTENDGFLMGDFRDKEIFSCFYQYDNANINFVFARLHFTINEWIKEYSSRFKSGNRYIRSGDRGKLNHFQNILSQFIKFFGKIGIEFNVNPDYRKLIFEGSEEINNAEGYIVGENFDLPNLIIDEPIFTLVSGNKFEHIRFLIFGAARTKPDIIVKDVLDGNLKVLNDSDVLVYDDEIKESLTYADFKIWWSKNKNKYSWYTPTSQMNEIELQVQEYYRQHYSDDIFPVLIPQVYLHYDPKDKETRRKYKYNENLIFQRMDFLILYKNRRVIIEIDGETHTPEKNLERYSKQLEYDRTMKFLGYDIFRLGGYELTKNFEKTVKDFFENLMQYLKVNQ